MYLNFRDSLALARNDSSSDFSKGANQIGRLTPANRNAQSRAPLIERIHRVYNRSASAVSSEDNSWKLFDQTLLVSVSTSNSRMNLGQALLGILAIIKDVAVLETTISCSGNLTPDISKQPRRSVYCSRNAFSNISKFDLSLETDISGFTSLSCVRCF